VAPDNDGYGNLYVKGVKDGMVHMIFRTDEFAIDMYLPPDVCRDLIGATLVAIAAIEGVDAEMSVEPDPTKIDV
jgi:hypothetical protein